MQKVEQITLSPPIKENWKLAALGNLELLRRKKLAIFCSVKCPGELIIKTYDWAKKQAESSLSIISGFHSPMEKQVLQILLRNKVSVIICPARGLEGMRINKEFKKPLQEGRLLLLSSFKESQKRATAQSCLFRNKLVAALADSVLVSYAEGGGKTEQLCREIIGGGKPVSTFETDANQNLFDLGVKPVNFGDPNGEEAESREQRTSWAGD